MEKRWGVASASFSYRCHGLPVIIVLSVVGLLSVSGCGSSPSIPAPTSVEVADGSVRLPDGTTFSKGRTFTLGEVSEKDLACGDPTHLKRLSDVELKLKPCQFRFIPAGIMLKTGEIEIWVHKKGTPFTARTPSAVLGVLGTRFNVEVQPNGDTRVRVSEGRVDVTSNSGQKKSLSENEGAAIVMSGTISDLASSLAPPASGTTNDPKPPESALREANPPEAPTSASQPPELKGNEPRSSEESPPASQPSGVKPPDSPTTGSQTSESIPGTRESPSMSGVEKTSPSDEASSPAGDSGIGTSSPGNLDEVINGGGGS